MNKEQKSVQSMNVEWRNECDDSDDGDQYVNIIEYVCTLLLVHSLAI